MPTDQNSEILSENFDLEIIYMRTLGTEANN
jgi:hypothetical protein